MTALLRKLDKDGSCCLDPEELAKIFRLPHIQRQCDANGDGVVTIREWRDYVQKVKIEIFEDMQRLTKNPYKFTERMIAHRTEEAFDAFLKKLQGRPTTAAVNELKKTRPEMTWDHLAEYIKQQELIYEDDNVTEAASEFSSQKECTCDEAVCICESVAEQMTEPLHIGTLV